MVTKLAEEKPLIKFVYSKANDYRVIYANGIIGTVSPSGDILGNLFLESRQLPQEQVFEMEEGKVGKDVTPPQPLSFIREMKIGLVLSPAVARSIGLWLQNKADIAEAKPPKKEEKTPEKEEKKL